MTMPHLMNCCHSGDGWCLDCVKDLHDEKEELEKKVRIEEVLSWRQDAEAMQSMVVSVALSLGGSITVPYKNRLMVRRYYLDVEQDVENNQVIIRAKERA